MTERLFFALWPAEAQRLALARVQAGLTGSMNPAGRPAVDAANRDAIAAGQIQPHPAGPNFHGRLTHPEDIPLTLVFLGAISAEQRRRAEAAAGRVRSPVFELTLDRVGSFPRARVVWCGTDRAPAPLDHLVTSLRDELRDCGVPLDSRPFAPHATLARNARPLTARPLDRPIHWPVEAFVLAYGREGPPPRYRILRCWPLALPWPCGASGLP